MDEATRAIVALLLDYPPSWAYGAMFEGVPCRVWIGRVDKDGYGMTYNPVTGYPYRTARMAWEVVNGPIPPGLASARRAGSLAAARPVTASRSALDAVGDGPDPAGIVGHIVHVRRTAR